MLRTTGSWNGEHNLNSIFERLRVSKARGYAILRERTDTDRTFPYGNEVETRGAPKRIPQEKIWEMEELLEQADVQERSMSWQALGYEVGLDVAWRTIQRVMGALDYHKCVACRKGWVNKDLADERLRYAEIMLERYPTKEHWRKVRFSDEVHFGLGPQGRLMIIRKPGQRFCKNCIQETAEPAEKKKVHAWGAIGYNFKSDLVFYDVPLNTNGKMTLKVYRDQILDLIIKPWLQAGQDFVLEEDRDSGHGVSKYNIVREWKEEYGLKHYFNCPRSPDLAPIENVWGMDKAYMRKFTHWTKAETEELAAEAWNEGVSQESINRLVDSMPARLKAVIDMGGKMTGY